MINKKDQNYMPLPILRAYKIPEPIREYKFHADRKWRLDYCWIEYKLACEIEGGLWCGGRHNRPASMIKDMEKYNALTELGWKLLRYTPQTLDYEQIKRCLKDGAQ